MAKKVTTTPKKVEKTIEKTENLIELDQIPTPTVEEINESVKNADINISTNDGIKEIEKKIDDILTPLNDLTNEIAAVGEISNDIQNNPDAAKEYIEEAIKKAENVKAKINKVLSNAETNTSVTNWWNGMGYDI